MPAQGFHALTGATVHVSPEKTLDAATVAWRNGQIVSVGEGPAPAGAQVHDGAGLHVYAGFIEPYLEVDVPRPDPAAPGSHWNARVTPQRTALDKGSRGIDGKAGETLREMGFTAAAISPRGGIFRGRSAVVSLAKPSGDPSGTGAPVYMDAAYQCLSFDTSSVGAEGVAESGLEDVRWERYPDSQMGAIALIRQTLSDADWQAQPGQPGHAANALDAIAPRSGATLPPASLMLFDVSDSLEAIRAAKIGREFSRPVAVLGSGREYQRLGAIVEDRVPIILPLNFPRAPEVGTVGEANAVELEDLMHFEQAPTNPRRVDAAMTAAGRAGEVSLTTSKAESGRGGGRRGGRRAGAGAGPGGPPDGRDQFDERLAAAIKHGLPTERALAMLTINPAKLLGVESTLGSVEVGKAANFVVSDGPLFADRPDAPKKSDPGYIKPARIVEVWIDGERYPVKPRPEVNIAGHYEATFDPPLPADVKVSFDLSEDDPPEFTIYKATRDATGHEETAELKVKDFDRSGPGLDRFTFSFEHEPFGEKGVFQNSGLIGRDAEGEAWLHGDFVRASGKRMAWSAKRTGAPAPKKPSLAGAWPIVFEGGGGSAPGALWGGNGSTATLVFDRGNVLSVLPAMAGRGPAPAGAPQPEATPKENEHGEAATPPSGGGRGRRGTDAGGPGSTKADNFVYTGKTVKFDLDQAQAGTPGGEGIAKVEAEIDWNAKPARMTGTVATPDGKKAAWTSTRRDSNPFAGEWRVTQADGQAMPPAGDGNKGLTIKIGGRRDKPSVDLIFERAGKPPITITADDEEVRGGKLFFTHDLGKLGVEGKSTDELSVSWGSNGPEGDVLVGLGRTGAGADPHPYEAKRTRASLEGDKKEAAAIAAIPEKIGLPFGGYARSEWGGSERVVITNATIWTCKDGEGEHIINDGAVVISDGKIQYAGIGAGTPRLTGEFTTIDAKGRFVAPGIIDCHSHTGISKGVNESGQAVTAEVRIGDVTDPNDVSWYRQLAGGVTCVSNLHGSANAIGGQNQVNKIRWGCPRPDDMHFEGAIPGIKFALGENPKQSNWGDRNTTRYPQTRMGVETLIRDRFSAAREYLDQWIAYETPRLLNEADHSPNEWIVTLFKNTPNADGSLHLKLAEPPWPAVAPRRDLELEALAQILVGQRLIHCHSYRQDEILMLCRVAKDFGFKIGTFQHILEGYKVADELAKWSGGGSSFSDWWAYKWEVIDAIPADGPLMMEQGVTVSYNSDSDEMARRLNVEAGKAAKYSGQYGGTPIPPSEAYKFVTLNPAKQLRIDKVTGSLEAGKDADLCIWSGPPTSPTSRCEATWVDGRRLFSLEMDAEHRRHIAAERARLVQKVLAAGGAKGRGGRGSEGGDDDEGPVAEVRSKERGSGERESLSSDLSEFRFEISSASAAGRRLMLLESVQQADDRRRDVYMNMLLKGLDPRWMRAGDCGCGW